MKKKDQFASEALRFAYDRYIAGDAAKVEAFEAELGEPGGASSVGRLADGVARCFSLESAERLAAFQLDAETRARVEYLAGRSNEGLLTREERIEYDTLVTFLDVLTLLKAKVRRRFAGEG